ncbi:hypothetical protein Landi51_09824 [Colletotrichum acutatum]
MRSEISCSMETIVAVTSQDIRQLSESLDYLYPNVGSFMFAPKTKKVDTSLTPVKTMTAVAAQYIRLCRKIGTSPDMSESYQQPAEGKRGRRPKTLLPIKGTMEYDVTAFSRGLVLMVLIISR